MSKKKKDHDRKSEDQIARVELPRWAAFALDRPLLRALLAPGGILADVEVVASPITKGEDKDSKAKVSPVLAAFAARLGEVAPHKARRSSDRVFNLNQLHDALLAKFEAVLADDGVDGVLGIDFEEPRELLHRIDPEDPRRWIRIRGTASYGGNLYEVFLPDGSSQTIGIQYLEPKSED